MGLSSCVWKRDFGRVSTGRVSGIVCMPPVLIPNARALIKSIKDLKTNVSVRQKIGSFQP